MKIRFTRRALFDRGQILEHLNQSSKPSARNVITRLDSVIHRIGDQPGLGTPTNMRDVRVVFAGRYPYRVFYRVTNKQVQILHIRHTAQNDSDIQNTA
jgi:plasmid stabilization system protein ParE